MADEPESPEHGDDGDIEIDVESIEPSCKLNSNALRRNKGQWTDQEIQVFEKGLELFGHKWSKIADLLETRTAAQVKSFSKKFLQQKEIDESESLILISALTSSKVHMKMDETNEELNVDDSLPSTEHFICSKDESIDTSNVTKPKQGTNKPDIDNATEGHPELSPELQPRSPLSDSNGSVSENAVTCDSEPTNSTSTDYLCCGRTKECNPDTPADVKSCDETSFSSKPLIDTIDESEIISVMDSNTQFSLSHSDSSGTICAEAEQNVERASQPDMNETKSPNDASDSQTDKKDSVTLTCQGKDHNLSTLNVVCERISLIALKNSKFLDEGSNLELPPCKNTNMGKSLENILAVDGQVNVACDEKDIKGESCSNADSDVINVEEEPVDENQSVQREEFSICENDGCDATRKENSQDDKNGTFGRNIVESCSRDLTDPSLSVKDGMQNEPSTCVQEANSGDKESCNRSLKGWNNQFENETINSSASDIIPEDEATKICDALLQTLSPMTFEPEPEENFFVSIKLENLIRKLYRKRACRTSTRRQSYYIKQKSEQELRKIERRSTEECHQKNEPVEKEIDIAREPENRIDKIKKRSKYRSLPKRSTRHSKPQDTDIPETLIVSISLDKIDSYCEEEQEDKPACLLSTHTYSEGWMVQEEKSEDACKKSFCVDNIYVDQEAFGVMKYRTVDENGTVNEEIKILARKTAPANYIWPSDDNEGPLSVPSSLRVQKDLSEKGSIENDKVLLEGKGKEPVPKEEEKPPDKEEFNDSITTNAEKVDSAKDVAVPDEDGILYDQNVGLKEDKAQDSLLKEKIILEMPSEKELQTNMSVEADVPEVSACSNEKRVVNDAETLAQIAVPKERPEEREQSEEPGTASQDTKPPTPDPITPNVSSEAVMLSETDVANVADSRMEMQSSKETSLSNKAVVFKDAEESNEPGSSSEAARKRTRARKKKERVSRPVTALRRTRSRAAKSDMIEPGSMDAVEDQKPGQEESNPDVKKTIVLDPNGSDAMTSEIVSIGNCEGNEAIDVTGDDSVAVEEKQGMCDENMNDRKSNKLTELLHPDDLSKSCNNSSQCKSNASQNDNVNYEECKSEVQDQVHLNTMPSNKKRKAKKSRNKANIVSNEESNAIKKVLRPRRGASRKFQERVDAEIKEALDHEDVTISVVLEKGDIEKEESNQNSNGKDEGMFVEKTENGVESENLDFEKVKDVTTDDSKLSHEKHDPQCSSEEDKDVDKSEITSKAMKSQDCERRDFPENAELSLPPVDNGMFSPEYQPSDNIFSKLGAEKGVDFTVEKLENEKTGKEEVLMEEKGNLIENDTINDNSKPNMPGDLENEKLGKEVNIGTFGSDSIPGVGFHELDLTEEHRTSVSSLDNELFGMNSCGLEFTLPGMAKDVLIKRTNIESNSVKSNEIEDCLRLPPADKCTNVDELNDVGQRDSLTCEDDGLPAEIQCTQSLGPSEMRLDCLSPFGDTSKFLNMQTDERNPPNTEFESVSHRIDKFDRDFQDKHTFFNDNGADPFPDSESEVGFKSSDTGPENKWDQVMYNNGSRPGNACLMEDPQITELRDDPFINGDELNSGSNADENLLQPVDNFQRNDISDSQSNHSDDDKYDLPSGQFENVDLQPESFECAEELNELPPEVVSYSKEPSEGYSSGSSSDDEDDEDEDSDSSESDSDSSSSSSSSRSDDEDDNDTEEESESSDSESDLNEELKNDPSFEDAKSDISSVHEENDDKEIFIPLKIDEVIFEEFEILPIERKECREFFMGKLSKTPEKYLNIRKFIIKEWNKIRPAYLTKNSIRSKVDPTDANAVGRVFMFLENYGAINVGCSVKNKWVERMERRRMKYFNSRRVEGSDNEVVEQKRKRGRPPQKDKVVPPRPAEMEIFLDFNVITEEEKNANPQFFNGNKNKSPEKYLKMRNSIISCWLDSKPAYLTKQAARMAMSWYCGDVNAVSRVHDYLEQIGAINFGCAQEPRRGRPSRARMNQERLQTTFSEKESKREKSRGKEKNCDSKAARMKSAQKKLEDITREVELEMGLPGLPCNEEEELIPYKTYNRGIKRSNNDVHQTEDGNSFKPKSKRGRKPKIRQCEPDSTVQDDNLLSEKDLIRAPKNGLIPVKDLISERESGQASDKSSGGDSGFDSMSEISPLLGSDMRTMSIKANGSTQDQHLTQLEDECDEQSYPLPTREKILDLSVITEEEKLGCPEFFVGSRVKPPEKYVKIRDSILKSWHSRKPFYLNKHNARCEMPWYTGDINSIGRVHAYLEKIGAINYGSVQRPKRNGKNPTCRKRKLADSPRYDIPSPETEEEDNVSDKLMSNDTFNNDLITADERNAFKRFLTEGNGMDSSLNGYPKVKDLITDMWAKCKQKYLAKSEMENSYVEEEEVDSNSDTGDESYVESRTVMNGTYPEGGKNGMWDMTKTFSLGLRPRKRWKMDINHDWIDRTESEGYTIKHLSPDDDRMESRARPLSFASKVKKSLPESDPYKLVPCRTFPSENAQPFTVTICLKALLVMDFHSHLSSSEVIGLVGGKYYHASRRLEIMRVAPCSNVGTNLQCEMDPVSQAKALSDLAQHGLDVVGWYHSHPTFAPTPSLRDIDTQSTFQEWFSRAGAPFVGIIISPYNMSNNEVPHKSQITCLTISDQWDESRSYRIPYMFKFKTEDLDKSDSFDDTRDQLKQTMQTVDGCKKYLCQARLGNTPPGLLLLKSFEAKLNRKTSKKDEVLSQVRDLIGI